MKYRPEADTWPIMTDDELRALAADIDEHGQQFPISVYQGEILDGRNRWEAVTRFAQKNKLPHLETVNPASPISFVISRNEKRRHATKGQRDLAAAKALPFFEAEARQRQAQAGASAAPGRPKSGPIGPQLKHRARDDAAKAYGTSPRAVERGNLLLKKGSKKLQEAVAANRISMGKAEEIIRNFADKRQQDIQVDIIARSKMVSRVKGLTGEIEWYTPRPYLDAAVEVMGGIDLDPASSAAAQEHVRATQWFGIEQDGLAQVWRGRVFLNPPYAMPYIKQFTAKIVESWQRSEITDGILLTNNATDTEWFHHALDACAAVCLTRGRIQFLQACDGELTQMASPTHGQAFFYFGWHVEAFADVFGRFGTILHRYQLPGQMRAVA